MSFGNSLPNSQVDLMNPSRANQMELQQDQNSSVSETLSKKAAIGIRLNPIDNGPRSRRDYLPVSNDSSPTKSNQRGQQTDLNSSPARNRFKTKVPKGYQLASYEKAEKHFNSRSYKKKAVNHQTGQVYYEPIQVCGGSISELKQYGLGIYFYFQFIKRLAVTLFIISIISILPLLESYYGEGLLKYTKSGSYSMLLAKFSLGNIQLGDRQTYMIISVADFLSVLIMIIFYIHWRRFHRLTIDQMQRDTNILNPISYAVTVQQFHDEMTNTKTLQKQLKTYIDAVYRGAYQVEVVFDYNGYFDKFIEYDEKIQLVEKQRQILKQTNNQTNKLIEEQKNLRQIEKELQLISQSFEPKYAIIHFRTLKAKLAFINHCKRFNLTDSVGDKLAKAICCTPNPPDRLLFLQKFPLSIKNSKLSRPEEINWRNMDLSSCSSRIRFLISIFLVIIVIIITSSLVSLSTLYAASISSCQSYISPAQATVTLQIAFVKTQSQSFKFCYCNQNIHSTFTDDELGTFCNDIQSKILVTNALQIASSVVSAATNVILSILVSLIAQKVLRPSTKPKQYVFIFWCVLISNYLNTAILPLVINANIYGTQLANYLKFLNFMNFDNLSVFSDFNMDWYGIISPYYVTFMIIASFISPFISLFVMAGKHCLKHWKVMRMCSRSDRQNAVIQKQVDAAITQLQFDYPVENAQIILLLFIVFLYSGLIPLLIPIFTIGLIIIYLCKRAMILKYSVKIPANEDLNQSIINFFPYIILCHGLFSIWSHTTPGIFAQKSQIYSLDMKIFNSQIDRILKDVIILAQPAIVIVILVLNYTIINFFGCLAECCKDQLQMPPQFASIQNSQFSQRLQKSNILGSYKLINNPTYGHAIKAYNELLFRKNKNLQGSQLNQNICND